MTNSKNKISLRDAGKSVSKWFREMRSELKKVVWPTRKQLINNCIIAVAVMVVCGLVIGAFDQIARLITIDLIIGKLSELFGV